MAETQGAWDSQAWQTWEHLLICHDFVGMSVQPTLLTLSNGPDFVVQHSVGREIGPIPSGAPSPSVDDSKVFHKLNFPQTSEIKML